MTRRRAASVSAVLVAFAVPLLGAYTDVGGAMEEGFMLVFPERVLAGEVPNRDFLHLYGPGSLWVLAAAFALLEPHLLVERTVGAVQLLGAALAVRALTAPWGHAIAAACGVIAVVFAVTPVGLVALAWMGGLAWFLWGALLVTRSIETDSRRLAVAGGAVVGTALLYRPDLAVAAGLVAAVSWRGLGRHRSAAALGLAVPAAAGAVHAAVAGVANAVQGMLVEPVIALRPGRSLPVPPSADTLDGYLQRIAELDVIDWPAPFTIPVQLRSWFFVVVATTLLTVAAAVVARRRSDRDRSHRMALLAAIAVGILPQAVQRPDSTHLAWVSAFTLAVAPVTLAELLPAAVDRTVRLWAGAAAVAVLAAVAFPAFTLRPYAELVLQSAGERRTSVEVRHRDRLFYVGRRDVADAVEALAPTVEALTDDGDALFVGPRDLTRTPYVDTWLYHLFPQLVPSTRFIEMDPGVADAPGSGLARDLAAADVAILTDTWDEWVEPNRSMQRGDRAAASVLAARFCLVAERDGVAVLRRCR